MPDVARWYKFRAARSPNSADVNLGSLLRTLDRFGGKEPKHLLKMKQAALDEYMQDLIDYYIENEIAVGSTVKKYVEAIKSYLSYHRKKVGRPLSIPGADDNPKAEAQEIPDQQKIAELLAECDLRTTVMVDLEAFAGVRPMVLAKFDGSDGLTLGDFPELEITERTIKFTKVPTRIRVRKEISKTRKAYTTFLGPQGCDDFLAYLRKRRADEEELTRRSAAVTHEQKEPVGGFLRRGNLQDSIRARMRRVGMASSSYILRSYFDNRMVMAESHGVPALYSEFWMGHKGGMQTRYALRKEVLPDDVIEDMRRCYAKALPFLETRRGIDAGDPTLPMVTVLLQAAGYSEAQLAKLNLESKSKDELIALVSRPGGETVGKKSDERKQKVVGSAQLETALLDGWFYRASLPDGRAIIERI